MSHPGGVPPAIFIICASYAGCDKLLVVFWFILAIGFMGNHFSGFRVNSLDLSPNYAGSLMALVNGAGALTGVVAPIFVGIMTPNSSLQEWRFVFFITFALTIARTVFYLIWGSAKVQSWNDPTK